MFPDNKAWTAIGATFQLNPRRYVQSTEQSNEKL